MSVSFYVNDKEIMNQANGNFMSTMKVIGVDMDWGGSMAGADLESFREKLEFAVVSLSAMPALDAGRPTVEHKSPGRCTVIECGLPDGYFLNKIGTLLKAVDKAISENVPLTWS